MNHQECLHRNQLLRKGCVKNIRGTRQLFLPDEMGLISVASGFSILARYCTALQMN